MRGVGGVEWEEGPCNGVFGIVAFREAVTECSGSWSWGGFWCADQLSGWEGRSLGWNGCALAGNVPHSLISLPSPCHSKNKCQPFLKRVCIRRQRPTLLRGSRVYRRLPLSVHRRRMRSQLHLNRYPPWALMRTTPSPLTALSAVTALFSASSSEFTCRTPAL